MSDELFLLIVGFLLTSVVGGALGAFFQNRAWEHRRDQERIDERRRQAMRTFEETSTLLDRRLYRMRQLWWAIKRMDKDGTSQRLNLALEGYREVLFAWNDNLNRLLALVQDSFGTEVRDVMEATVLEEFSAIGRALDHGVMIVSGDAEGPVPALGGRLRMLSNRVYWFDLVMLEQLKSGDLGSTMVLPAMPEPPSPPLAFGSTGDLVEELQSTLASRGQTLDIDAVFGLGTDRAVRAAQTEAGIGPDGVVGPATMKELGLKPPGHLA